MVQESTNTFSDGLVSDLSSLTTPNTVLTDALNATILTFNGNELVLQNDMGNTKLKVPNTNNEYVQLPEGFIPLGMKEYGGVLYIISTNGEQIEIGSFPSLPEAPSDNDNQVIKTVNIGNLGELDNVGVPVNLNKNFLISDKLNSGEKFLIVLQSEDTNTISTFTTRKLYKPKLLSIEKGIETDITNTLSIQQKYKVSDNSWTENNNYWFLKLSAAEYAAFDATIKQKYIDNKKYQVYKPKKAGSLALRFELETIDSLTLTGVGKDGDNLKVSCKIVANSSMQANKATLNYNFIKDGISTSKDPLSVTNLTYNSGIATFYFLIPLEGDLNRIVEFTIKCENTTYGINFDKFIIYRSIDLTKEIVWEPIVSYKVESIEYISNQIITKILIAKYGIINNIEYRLDRYNQPVISTENQVAYYWNLLPSGASNTLITDKKYDVVGTFAINETTKKAMNPLDSLPNINEDPLTTSNLPTDVLQITVRYGNLYNLFVMNVEKSIVVGNTWRIPSYNDWHHNLLQEANHYKLNDSLDKALLNTGIEWNYLGENVLGFNGQKRGIILGHSTATFISNGVSWFNDNWGYSIIQYGNDIIGYDLVDLKQGGCIRLCTDVTPSNENNPPTYSDGVNTYNSVKIGNLYWLTEDLRTTKFNDNTSITQANNLSQWDTNCNNSTPCYTTLTSV